MKWIISNHKEDLQEEQLSSYIMELNKLPFQKVHLVICPRDSHLSYFHSTNYALGSQDVNRNKTIQELKKYSVEYTIVGHADKRDKYQETNAQINQKIKELLKNNIHPILCIGENRNSNIKEVLKQQLEEGLKNVIGNIIIAYEPIWAINSGEIPEVNSLKNTIEFIKQEATEILTTKPIVLYGGSVNENTINDLEKIEELDGYLIGKASLDIEKLKKLIEVVK